ncbi:MAG: DUF3299 domain-containing protein [Rubrivivax sp.]|jgi:hypothetical protein|nr:DUF3299 domain-containing protein [Rubrivivax sp.]
MSIDVRRRLPGRQPLKGLLAVLACALPLVLGAQGQPQLASPIAPAPSTKPGSPPPTLTPGSGPGFHDPRSAFKPLEEREGVVSWKLLSTVTARVERDRVIPVFPQPVKALDGQALKVQGFMMPLEPGERQRHFLLSAVPTTCSFCVPAGPEGLVEVRTREPVRYTVDAVTIQGRFAVLTNDKFGLFYRVADATLAPN